MPILTGKSAERFLRLMKETEEREPTEESIAEAKRIKDLYLRVMGNDKNKEPIYRGCPNKICGCTGKCQEIIGYRGKHPLER